MGCNFFLICVFVSSLCLTFSSHAKSPTAPVSSHTIEETAKRADTLNSSSSSPALSNPETIQSLKKLFDNDTPFDAFQKLIQVFLSTPSESSTKEFPLEKLCTFWIDLLNTPPYNNTNDLEWQAFLIRNKAFVEKILFGNNAPNIKNCGKGYISAAYLKTLPGTKDGKNLQLVLKNIDPPLTEKDPPQILNPITKAKYYFHNPKLESCPPNNKPCYKLSLNLAEHTDSKKASRDFDVYSRDGGSSYSNYTTLKTGSNLTQSARYKDKLKNQADIARKNFENLLAKKPPVLDDNYNQKLIEAEQKYTESQKRFIESEAYNIVAETKENFTKGASVKTYSLELDPMIHPNDNSSNTLYYDTSAHFTSPTFKYFGTTVYKNPSGSVVYLTRGGWGLRKGNIEIFGFGFTNN